jgi:hypothetical protein
MCFFEDVRKDFTRRTSEQFICSLTLETIRSDELSTRSGPAPIAVTAKCVRGGLRPLFGEGDASLG